MRKLVLTAVLATAHPVFAQEAPAPSTKKDEAASPAAAAESPPAEAASSAGGTEAKSTEGKSEPRKLSPDDLVEIALGESGLVGEAEGKVTEWRGRLAEVQAVFYPKLTGMGFIAPMFRVRGSPQDVIGALDVDRDYSEWGPYFHLEAVLAQPLYTFGRASAGKKAAENRLKVEQARARQTRNALALEVRKFYYLHLYAKTMQPSLESARKILDGALETAQKLYDEGTGKVTQIDLQKLFYASAELDKYLIQAQLGAELALEALKQTMGLPATAALVLAHEQLPPPPTDPLPSYEQLLEVAMKHRPEWEQVNHGKIAAVEFEKSERRASYPVLFAAGQFGADWTPMRPDVKNPYYKDDYNGLSGGVAVGLQFDVDIAKSQAKAKAAHGVVEQVEALEKFAATGIPMELRKAHSDAVQAARILEVAQKGSVAARKWMVFAGAAYTAGTGEAKDVLEGLAAYTQSRKSYYETLQNLHTAHAYLLYATGRSGVEDRARSKVGGR